MNLTAIDRWWQINEARVWSTGGMIMIEEKQITRKKILISATLSSKYHIWTGLRSNQWTAVAHRQLIAHRGGPGLITIQSVWDLCGWSSTSAGFSSSTVVLSLRITAKFACSYFTHPTHWRLDGFVKWKVPLSLPLSHYGVSRPSLFSRQFLQSRWISSDNLDKV